MSAGTRTTVWRIAPFAALVAMAFALATPTTSHAAPPIINPDHDATALEDWVPVDGPEGWTPGPELHPSEADDDCDASTIHQFVRADGTNTILSWTRCNSPELAQQRALSVWANTAMWPVPDEDSTLADGNRLIGLWPGTNGVHHLWAQGSYFLALDRGCVGDEYGERCLALTRADADSVATVLGSEVADLETPPDARATVLDAWLPIGDETWTRTPETLTGDSECEGAASLFTDTDGAEVELLVATCSSQRAALAFGTDQWVGANTGATDVAPIFGLSADTAARTLFGDQKPRVSRWWVQGTTYVAIHRVCTVDDAECVGKTAEYARSLTLWVRGEVATGGGFTSLFLLLGVLIGAPIVTYLLLLVPRQIVAWRRSAGYAVAPTDAAFTPVDRLVRRVRWSRAIRRLIILVATIGTFIALFGVTLTGSNDFFAYGLLLSPFVCVAAYSAVLGRIWRTPRLLRPPRARRRPSPGVIGEMVVRGLAVGLAVVSIEAYVIGGIFLLQDSQRSRPAFEASTPPEALYSPLRRLFYELTQSGAIWVVFLLILAVPIFLAYLLDRLGRRIGRRSLRATLEQDTRPYFVYLRGFDEDRLRVDESLGRRGVIELLTPFGRPRFEEVVVEHLSGYGPVIAISGARQRLADLGAAKITLGGDEWRSQVAEWVGGARAIVMSATPREVRAGLEWEIEHLANRTDAPPLMLVVAPWPRRELARRWQAFLEKVTAWPMFSGLIAPSMPTGVQIATYSSANGWHGYGARRRWDWSYAASILTAIDAGDLGRE